MSLVAREAERLLVGDLPMDALIAQLFATCAECARICEDPSIPDKDRPRGRGWRGMMRTQCLPQLRRMRKDALIRSFRFKVTDEGYRLVFTSILYDGPQHIEGVNYHHLKVVACNCTLASQVLRYIGRLRYSANSR